MDIDIAPPCERQLAYACFLERAQRPFEWGVWDCVTFANEAVRCLTGRDYLAGMAWNSAVEAARLLRERGGLRAAVTECLGEPVAPGFACAGDVVLAADPHAPDGRELLAVCHGPYLIAPGAAGLTVLPLSAGVCGWRIPHG